MWQESLERAKAERLQGNLAEAKIILNFLIEEFRNIVFESSGQGFNTGTPLSKIYNELGLVEYMEVNFFDAIKCFNKALNLDCQHAAYFYNRGLIYYRLGDFMKALEDMQEALIIDPTFRCAISCRNVVLKDL